MDAVGTVMKILGFAIAAALAHRSTDDKR